MKPSWEFASTAEEVEWLRAEVERLRAERNEARRHEEESYRFLEEKEAEVERLRAALEVYEGPGAPVEWKPVAKEVGTGGYVQSEEDRLQAEVERLRAGLDQKNQHEAALNNTIARLREDLNETLAEVERLREQGGLYVEALDDKDAEVERLRAENEGLRGNLKGNPVLSTFDGIANLQAEVERLRALVEKWYQTYHTAGHAQFMDGRDFNPLCEETRAALAKEEA